MPKNGLKILILHASAGHGHASAARAVENALLAANPETKVSVHDALDFMPSFWGKFYRDIYFFLIKYTPWLWALLYNGHDFVVLSYLLYPLRRLFNFAVSRRLVDYVLAEKPDSVICTHFMPNEVVAYLKKTNQFHGQLVTVITDLMPHYFWLSRFVDYFVSGSAETTQDLLKRCINAERIIESGIPVDPVCERVDCATLKQKLQLDPARFTLLLTNGGAGIGAVEEMCAELVALSDQLQLVVVTGTNRALQEKLNLQFAGNMQIRICGFVDNMPEWIAASDLVIGKSGGLTVAETMAIGKPMILLRPVPGQEVHNARILTARGNAMLAHSTDQAIEQVSLLLDNPHLLQSLQSNAVQFGKPQSAHNLARFVLDTAPHHYTVQPMLNYTLNPRAA